MTEGIGARVGRIVAGSLNAVIDAVENASPEMVMEQAVREIDAAIDDVRAELGQAKAEQHLASKRLADNSSRHEKLSADIELAVAEGRDELAETAISHQIDLEAQVPVLEQTITNCAEREKELEGYIAALQARKREMQSEIETYHQHMKDRETTTGDDGAGPARPASVDSRVEKASSAFDRVLRNNTGVGGTATADAKTATQLAELEKLSRDNKIKERLAEVKTAAGKGKGKG